MPGDARQDCFIVPGCPHCSDGRRCRYFSSGGDAREDCLIVPDCLHPSYGRRCRYFSSRSCARRCPAMPGRTVCFFLIVLIPRMAADVVISAAGAIPGDAREDCFIVPDCLHPSYCRRCRYFSSMSDARRCPAGLFDCS